jgi:hypothetical protein
VNGVPSVGALANGNYNALGHRMKDLPITKDRILGVLACRGLGDLDPLLHSADRRGKPA